MSRELVLISVLVIPAFIEAAGPQATPQIYSLAGKKNQMVMLSNWPEGKVFSRYEDHRGSTLQFFKPGQDVWIWCGKAASTNRIESIQTSTAGIGITTVTLEHDPGCRERPSLMSNDEFPKQRWRAGDASQEEVAAIREKLASRQALKVTRITSEQRGTFFLVFDPGIPAIYESGGHRLMDERLNQVSVVEQAPLTPLIDLDGDSVPEFFVPSSDGMDAWLYRLFPKIDREMSHDYVSRRAASGWRL
jgi:hypothetical protein